MFDVIIIGAGVTGSAVARELTRTDAKICVIEKEADVCCGTSKANSGIVHAGYDAVPGSLKAKMNIEGSLLMGDLADELDFKFRRTGSLVVCKEESGIETLEKLYAQGQENGVPDLEIIRDRKRIAELEPELSDDVLAVLYAPSAGIVCPFGLNIALAENALSNGALFRLNTEVKNIVKGDGFWILDTGKEKLETRAVVNAAGVYADSIHNMVSENKLHITPRKGEYYLFDKTVGGLVSHTIFGLPGKKGKGVLVTPTADGNLMTGPTSNDIEDKEGTNTTMDGLEEVRNKSTDLVKGIRFDMVITSFAGLRAHEDAGDFVIGEVSDAEYFFDCAGIESPGLTSAPAIGKYLAEIIKERLDLGENPDFNGKRKGYTDINKMSEEEYCALVKEKPEYGHIICRCENISEGQIIEAVNNPLGAVSMDGIKRRVRAGAGRCQSGFCSAKVMEIIDKNSDENILKIKKNGRGSSMVAGYIK